MKKLFLFLAVAFSISMMAQMPAKPQEKKSCPYSIETMAMMRADKVAQQIDITAQEKTKLVALFTKEMKEKQAEKEAMQKKMEEKKAKHAKELTAILGAERATKVLESSPKKPEHCDKDSNKKAHSQHGKQCCKQQ